MKKNSEKMRKGGFDFADAWQVFENPLFVKLDDLADYGFAKNAVGPCGSSASSKRRRSSRPSWSISGFGSFEQDRLQTAIMSLRSGGYGPNHPRQSPLWRSRLPLECLHNFMTLGKPSAAPAKIV